MRGRSRPGVALETVSPRSRRATPLVKIRAETRQGRILVMKALLGQTQTHTRWIRRKPVSQLEGERGTPLRKTTMKQEKLEALGGA